LSIVRTSIGAKRSLSIKIFAIDDLVVDVSCLFLALKRK
jgi:hypothetical protein